MFKFNGHQKGLHDKQGWSTISQCTLITSAEAEEISKIWGIQKEKNQHYDFIITKIQDVKDDNVLIQIVKIIEEAIKYN